MVLERGERNRKNIITGQVHITGPSKKSARVILEGGEIVKVKKEHLSGAETGDTVEVKIQRNRDNFAGKIISVLHKKEKTYVGRVLENGNIFLNGTEIKASNLKLKTGLVRLRKTDIGSYEVVGNIDKKWANYTKELDVIYDHGFDVEFSQKVIEEVGNIKNDIESELEKRSDLRDLFTITIDGKYSKDFDDAISIKKLNNGDYKLYVHIADVTHYVKPGSNSDLEAFNRGTSLYNLDFAVPMLHEKLSNDLCSLNPKTDKLAMTCEIYIKENGEIHLKKSKVYESVINSNHRTTYQDIQKISEKKLNIGDELFSKEKLDKKLNNFTEITFELSNLLGERRAEEGELLFKLDNFNEILNEKKEIIGYEKQFYGDSNEMIKNFMVAANFVVSSIFTNNEKPVPFIHRIHEAPNNDKIKEICNLFKAKGIDLENTELSYENLSEIIEKLQKVPGSKTLQKKVLRVLKLAKYSTVPTGHHGLALEYYSHFTSPIRRYADLQIHRIIKSVINKEKNLEKKLEKFGKNLDFICQKINFQEKLSEEINIRIKKNKALEYYAKLLSSNHKIDENKLFSNAEVSIVSDGRVIAELSNGVEIELILDGKNGYFTQEDDFGNYTLYNIYDENKTFQIGDKIKTEVSRVNFDQEKIYAKIK